MRIVNSWEAVQRLASEVNRSSPGFSTSFFLGRSQVEALVAAAPVHALTVAGAVLFIQQERSVQRVYHLAESESALSVVLRMLPAGAYVADLVGQGTALERIAANYTDAGFTAHGFLRRMVRNRAAADVGHGPFKGQQAKLATTKDVEAVFIMLNRLLDPFIERVPDRHELETAVADRRLLIVSGEYGPVGMLMFDRQGQLVHLRFWHVHPDFHGAGIGRSLMSAFFANCTDARRIVLWVIGDNDRSISIYRHYGFIEDGLLDRVMTLEKGQNR